MKTLDHTVHATSGSAAASTSETPAGTGISWPTGTATRAAYPPPVSSAQTSSPTDQPSASDPTSGPSSAIVPLHSRPMISELPGGTG